MGGFGATQVANLLVGSELAREDEGAGPAKRLANALDRGVERGREHDHALELLLDARQVWGKGLMCLAPPAAAAKDRHFAALAVKVPQTHFPVIDSVQQASQSCVD